MAVIKPIRLLLNSKNSRTLLLYYGIFLLVFTSVMGIIIYNHFSRMKKLTSDLKALNKQRELVKKIGIKNKRILAQKDRVKTLLEEEPNFYIGQYLNDLIKEVPLTITSGIDMSETDVGNGFTERKLMVTFSHSSMKELTELLLKIEQKERVYIKEITINKDSKDGLLTINLTIATLETQQASV